MNNIECARNECTETFELGHIKSKRYCSDFCKRKDAKAKAKKLCNELVRLAKSVPCEDCGNSFPHYVMDLDHVRGTKIADVSDLVKNGSLKKVAEEIEKCDVVCSNCHRERTFSRGQHLADYSNDFEDHSHAV